jgi:hypothetical protein
MKRALLLFALIGAVLAQEAQPIKPPTQSGGVPKVEDLQKEIDALNREIATYQQMAFGCQAAQIKAQAKSGK